MFNLSLYHISLQQGCVRVKLWYFRQYSFQLLIAAKFPLLFPEICTLNDGPFTTRSAAMNILGRDHLHVLAVEARIQDYLASASTETLNGRIPKNTARSGSRLLVGNFIGVYQIRNTVQGC